MRQPLSKVHSSYRGGLKWSSSWSGGAGFAHATWPFAELVISGYDLQLRPTYRIMQPLFAIFCLSRMPDVRLGWDLVELAEKVRGSRFTFEPSGVRLWLRGKSKPIVFWSQNATSILDTLEAHNVPIDRSMHVSPLFGL
jgi:hypothetical protein